MAQAFRGKCGDPLPCSPLCGHVAADVRSAESTPLIGCRAPRRDTPSNSCRRACGEVPIPDTGGELLYSAGICEAVGRRGVRLMPGRVLGPRRCSSDICAGTPGI